VLPGNRVSAVLCSTDLERSQDFYEHKVGLKLSPATIKNHLVFQCADGTTLLPYGRPSPNKADRTQVRFSSAHTAADVQELVARGVEFDDLKMVAHVLTNQGRDVVAGDAAARRRAARAGGPRPARAPARPRPSRSRRAPAGDRTQVVR
jgi:hypothetical protein